MNKIERPLVQENIEYSELKMNYQGEFKKSIPPHFIET
jgi:hypothetical protein